MKPLRMLCFAALVGVLSANLVARDDRPNVLLIYTDDHRYTGVHALGGEPVQTPHLDRLAESGMVFTRAYLMGSFSVATCIPSRSMLLTGRNLFELEGIGRNIPLEHTTMGEAFGQAGYETYMVGKWHQDHASLSRSFASGATVMSLGVYLTDHYRMPLWDWNSEGKFAAREAYRLVYDANGRVVRTPVTEQDKRGPIGTEETGPHSSEIFAESAIGFFEQYDSKAPFFMYLAFHAPHDPRQAPKAYKARYPEEAIELPPSYLPQHPFDNGSMVVRDEALAPWPRTPEVARQHLSDYYAAITHLDAQIGRVIQTLKDRGLYEKTIIVMAGDSGLAVGCHGLMGKQNIYDEDGVHVPFIISGGPVARVAGGRFEALCYTHDIFPTICDLAGIEKPPSVTGLSLAPVIEGRATTVRDFTYHAYRQHMRAYREGDYKLIEFVRSPDATRQAGQFVSGSRVTQLFNLHEDPWETTDLSFHPDQRERVSRMREALQEQAHKIGDNPGSTGQPYDFWDAF